MNNFKNHYRVDVYNDNGLLNRRDLTNILRSVDHQNGFGQFTIKSFTSDPEISQIIWIRGIKNIGFSDILNRRSNINGIEMYKPARHIIMNDLIDKIVVIVNSKNESVNIKSFEISIEAPIKHDLKLNQYWIITIIILIICFWISY